MGVKPCTGFDHFSYLVYYAALNTSVSHFHKEPLFKDYIIYFLKGLCRIQPTEFPSFSKGVLESTVAIRCPQCLLTVAYIYAPWLFP